MLRKAMIPSKECARALKQSISFEIMASPLADSRQDSSRTSLLDGKHDPGEPAAITHLRALGITSSGFIRGAVQMGSMQIVRATAFPCES